MSVTNIYKRTSIAVQASSHAFQLSTKLESLDGKSDC